MRKIFRKIHLWLTIPFGIFIFTLFLTGAILVFQKDIIASANTGGWIYSIGWENPQPFFKSVLRLHRWLFDIPADKSQLTLGRAIVGISTIATGIILLSGIVIWIPRQIKSLKNRLKITSGKGIRRFLYDWHVAIGIYSVIFLLLMVLTGPAWTFKWYRSMLMGILPESASPMKLIYSLHTGNWGGIITKIIYCASAVSAATLVVTGYYLWIKKLTSKNVKQKTKQLP